MILLLTLDHTTLFFYTLCLSGQHHVASIEHWQSAIDKNLDYDSNSVPTPTLPYVSTHSSTTSSLKGRYDAKDSVINLCGPMPKKLRPYYSRTIANAIVDAKVNIDKNNDWYSGGLSDRNEMNGSEATAACLSPFKNGAWAMNSVSDF